MYSDFFTERLQSLIFSLFAVNLPVIKSDNVHGLIPDQKVKFAPESPYIADRFLQSEGDSWTGYINSLEVELVHFIRPDNHDPLVLKLSYSENNLAGLLEAWQANVNGVQKAEISLFQELLNPAHYSAFSIGPASKIHFDIH